MRGFEAAGDSQGSLNLGWDAGLGDVDGVWGGEEVFGPGAAGDPALDLEPDGRELCET